MIRGFETELRLYLIWWQIDLIPSSTLVLDLSLMYDIGDKESGKEVRS